jgi:hypothetical protein
MVRDVVNSPPVRCVETSRAIIITQLCPMDVYMYLVAIKTLTRFVAARGIHVVADGLSSENKELLKKQIHGIHIQDIGGIDTGDFPRGGTWERLLYILDRNDEAYVIQLDADTVTLASPLHVIECIAQNRSFTLGSYKGQEVITFKQASEHVRKGGNSRSQHVQMLAELAMEQFDNCDQTKYVRGNSAFAGFAKGQHAKTHVRRFSQTMENLIGKDKWSEWGSEQVTSNYAVANSDNPLVLPFPDYGYFNPSVKADNEASVFLHFMGTHRFSEGKYWTIARQSVSALP